MSAVASCCSVVGGLVARNPRVHLGRPVSTHAASVRTDLALVALSIRV